MTEKEIMLAGGMYDCRDEELMRERTRAHVLAQQLNALPADDYAAREKITRELLGAAGPRRLPGAGVSVRFRLQHQPGQELLCQLQLCHA